MMIVSCDANDDDKGNDENGDDDQWDYVTCGDQK